MTTPAQARYRLRRNTERIQRLETNLWHAKSQRDHLLREADQAGVPLRDLIRATGLSHTQIYRATRGET